MASTADIWHTVPITFTTDPDGSNVREVVYGDIPFMKRSVHNNPRDRRIKPKDLIAHTTASPKQWSYLEHSGWVARPILKYSDRWYWSAWEIPKDETYQEYGELPFWNWPLIIRKKMERLRVNLAETVAEYRATCRQYADMAIAVGNSADTLRKKVRSLRRAPLSTLGSHYLGFAFGIKPTVEDFARAAASLDARLEAPIWRRVATKQIVNPEGIVLDDDISVQYKWISKKRAVTHFLVEPSYQGINFGNPAALVWDLLPYSWLVDTVLNVGDTLHALDALKGVDQIVTTYSEKVFYEHQAINVNPDAIQHLPGLVSKRWYERTKDDSVPIPTTIEWDPSDSFYSVANASAFLAAKWGRQMPSYTTLLRGKPIGKPDGARFRNRKRKYVL